MKPRPSILTLIAASMAVATLGCNTSKPLASRQRDHGQAGSRSEKQVSRRKERIRVKKARRRNRGQR